MKTVLQRNLYPIQLSDKIARSYLNNKISDDKCSFDLIISTDIFNDVNTISILLSLRFLSIVSL